MDFSRFFWQQLVVNLFLPLNSEIIVVMFCKTVAKLVKAYKFKV